LIGGNSSRILSPRKAVNTPGRIRKPLQFLRKNAGDDVNGATPSYLNHPETSKPDINVTKIGLSPLS
jgi:hypothetical protein